MRAVLEFFSVLALGLIAAIVVATSVSSPALQQAVGGSVDAAFKLDYPSLVLGLVLGSLMATLARIGWAALPWRIANWLVANSLNFVVFACGVICAAVIIMY